MRVLVVGGTLFLGRAIVDRAVTAGHDVVLLNRGRTRPGLFPDLEQLVCDRNGDLSVLGGRQFDAVIDTCGYFPRQVRAMVEAVDDHLRHYTFVSSISVYADHSVRGGDETARLATVSDPSVEELGENYGGFKALCEQALDELLPGRVHHVRAGLIVGPYDYTGRFTYWIERIARGGEVLAPEPKDQPVQLIDVRDLADWIVDAAELGVHGAMNATGAPTSLAAVLEVAPAGRDHRGDPRVAAHRRLSPKGQRLRQPDHRRRTHRTTRARASRRLSQGTLAPRAPDQRIGKFRSSWMR